MNRVLLALFALILMTPLALGATITDNADGSRTYFDDFNDRTSLSDFTSEVFDAGTATGTGGAFYMSQGRMNIQGSDTSANGGQLNMLEPFCGSTGGRLEFDAEYTTAGSVPARELFYGATTYGTSLLAGSTQSLGIVVAESTGNTTIQAVATTSSGSSGLQSLFTTTDALGAGPIQFSVEFDGIDCSTGQAIAAVTVGNTTRVASLDAPGAWTTLESIGFWTNNAAGGHGDGWMDNVNSTISSAYVVDYAGDCPDPGGDSEFNWQYAKNVLYFEPGGTEPTFATDLSSGFQFSGQADDHAILSRAWSHTTNEVGIHSTIEAASETQKSVVAYHFHRLDPTSYLGGTTKFDAADFGNEETTGYLNTSLAVRFEEVGNDWHISLRNILNGVESQSGQAWIGGNPNAPTSFTIQASVSDDEIRVLNIDGDVVVAWPAPSDVGPITGVSVNAESKSSVAFAYTYINDADTSYQSSCVFWYDVAEGSQTVIGDPGLAPDQMADLVETTETNTNTGGLVGGGGPLDPQSAGIAFGISNEAAGWFFGLLFVVLVVAGFATINMKMAPWGIPVGIGGAVAFGYMPFWFVLFLSLILAAIVVLRFKTSTGAD